MYLRLAEILGYFPDNLKAILKKTFETAGDSLLEIRIRSGLPLIVNTTQGGFAVLSNGELSPAVGGAYIIGCQDLKRIFQAICENSVYAYAEDIRQGFVTIRGGHRVGITGKAAVSGRKIDAFREISSLNIRIAREVIGAANDIINDVFTPWGIKNTLIVAPPMGGKTTVLRDLARQLSDKGIKIGIADDRGEIACLYRGIPQNNIGVQTDVLENASKSEAIVMLLRSMSPQIIITDEIATLDDAEAIKKCFGTGVAVIATTHGKSVDEIKKRPVINELLGGIGFSQIIVLNKDGYGLNTRISRTVTEVV